jgi:amidohydrolase
MTVLEPIERNKADIVGWRRELHAHPELMYELPRTSAFVEGLLRQFGCDEVHGQIGRSGVVGIIKGRHTKPGTNNPSVGLRADMDALPIQEDTGLPYASTVPGRMHACGHDGHTAMLLGAARHLAETRNFSGTVVLIFQPAEEGGAGAMAMIEDGLMERFGIGQVYGMHNRPGLPIGTFAAKVGPAMAASDDIDIFIEGRGGHAARPNQTIDPVVVGAKLILEMQSIVSRNVDPLESAVISICQFEAGHARNVIPQTAQLKGTVRTLSPETRDLVERRILEVANGVASTTGASIKLEYRRGYPVLVNHERETKIAVDVASSIVGQANVRTQVPAVMGAEDFAYMLEARAGSFISIGNGDTAGLHHPRYDFNDEALVYGSSYFANLVETLLSVPN